MLAVLPALLSAGDHKPVGEIDFFGYKALDLGPIRSALPIHEGDLFPPARAKSFEDFKRQISDKIQQVTGRAPTDIAFVCCDSRKNWMVYIGLPGDSYQALAFHAAPTGQIRLPKTAIALRDEVEQAWARAVIKGHATEDDSEGYALTNDPKAKRAELALRDYALHNEASILQVLASSSDARHRAIAAQMLGYARQSDEQIDALVHASFDADDGVRNDAVRALEVLAGAKPNLAKRIPAEAFDHLLRSGAWSDHNKASLLLMALTKSRDPDILTLLRKEALDSLIEMARWRSAGHAGAALVILGRIASLDDDSVDKLIDAGQPEAIIGKLNRQ